VDFISLIFVVTVLYMISAASCFATFKPQENNHRDDLIGVGVPVAKTGAR